MAEFTKVAENGQIEFDFELIAKEVCIEFATLVSNSLRNKNSVVLSQDLDTLVFKEVVIYDGLYVSVIQANKTLSGWTVNKVILSKYDIKEISQNFNRGEV